MLFVNVITPKVMDRFLTEFGGYVGYAPQKN